MSQYLLLLYNDPQQWAKMSPEEMQKAVQKFVGWRNKLQTSGFYLGSNRLTDEPGKVLRGHKPVRVTDGPYSETKEILGGYFLFEAPNYEEAVRVSQDCPNLEYNGTMELREVFPMIP
ncbi:MAG TPA: YciI family protein [Terriglobales bacterium]|nr:YciI family protein [Terriglobales bacterium]